MQPPVDQFTEMKSGDKFSFNFDMNEPADGKQVTYTLQKLPDFPLWVLISEFDQPWMAPTDTSFGAFGGWQKHFTKII